MASQTLARPLGNSEQTLGQLFIELLTTTAGAVSTITRQNGFRTVTPVVRNSAGNYDIFLREAWVGRLVDCSITVKSGAAITSANAYVWYLVTDSTGLVVPKITIQGLGLSAGAFVAADIVNAGSLIIRLALKNS